MNASPSTTPSTSPPPLLKTPPSPEAPKESAVSRLFIVPLAFVSFLLSLALVDRQNYALRTHSHSPSRLQPPTTFFGKLTSFAHSLVYKPDSPYAYVKSPVIKAVDLGDEAKGGGTKPWYWHTKQKKLLKAEVADAFKIRKWVMIALVIVCIVVGLGILAFGRFMFGIWRNYSANVLQTSYFASGFGNGGNRLGRDW